MSASLSNIQPDEYLYFSQKTSLGCPGKSVKIHKKLAVAFIAAVDPKSHEGKAVISGIEQLTALAQDTQTQTHVNNAAVKMKAVGSITVCYVVTQAPGDRAPTVYITNFKQNFRSSVDSSGLYEINMRLWGRKRYKKKTALTSKVLFLNGLTGDISEAIGSGSAKVVGMEKFDLFYTSADQIGDMGAWSSPLSTRVSDMLAKTLESYSGGDAVDVFVDGYGASVLSAALPKVSNLSKFKFGLHNSVADYPSLIKMIDSKNGRYYHQDIIKIFPGWENSPQLDAYGAQEFNASKVALAYGRLSLFNRLGRSPLQQQYAQVLLELYSEVRGIPANKMEDGLKAQHRRTGHDISSKYADSYNVKNFVELINRANVSK